MKPAELKKKNKREIELLSDAAGWALLTLCFPCLCIGCGTWCFWQKITGKPAKFYCGTRNTRTRKEAELETIMEQALQAEAPAPLSRRKRALTLPLPTTPEGILAEGSKQTTGDQLQSDLFGRFPLEIRTMIYELVLADFTHIHLFRRQDNRLGHYKCHQRHRNESDLFNGEKPANTWTGAWLPGTWQSKEPSFSLPLLQTCRRA